jgi:hypothetical protein
MDVSTTEKRNKTIKHPVSWDLNKIIFSQKKKEEEMLQTKSYYINKIKSDRVPPIFTS